jgi:hypothetical protein
LPGGYRISAKPLVNQDYSFPQGKRFAVVLDSSRSMASHLKELTETFRWLKEKGFADNELANNDADLYSPQDIGGLKYLNLYRLTEDFPVVLCR